MGLDVWLSFGLDLDSLEAGSGTILCSGCGMLCGFDGCMCGLLCGHLLCHNWS